MNRLFLLIPAIGEKDVWQDVAYLKQLGKVDGDGVLAILRQIVQSFRLIEGEDMETLYDERHFKQMFRKIKQGESLQEMPQVENLLLFFNDAVSIQQLGIGKTSATINGMLVDKGLVNAYVEDKTTGKVLLNKDALINPEHPILVIRPDGEQLSLNPLPCEAADVYLWFVENRTPQRTLDPNYEKHGKKEKTGKGGVRISPITYPERQLDEFLKRAVVAKIGLRELYFKDNTKDKIIIFWDENLQNPSYHAMEIDADDAEEIQKLFKRGGRALKKRIEDTADLIYLYQIKEET